MDCKEQGNYALLLVQKNAENGQVNCHKKTIPNYKFCMSISPDFTLRDENWYEHTQKQTREKILAPRIFVTYPNGKQIKLIRRRFQCKLRSA